MHQKSTSIFWLVFLFCCLTAKCLASTDQQGVLAMLESDSELTWEIESSYKVQCPYINCSKAYLMSRGYWGVSTNPIFVSEDSEHHGFDEENAHGDV